MAAFAPSIHNKQASNPWYLDQVTRTIVTQSKTLPGAYQLSVWELKAWSHNTCVNKGVWYLVCQRGVTENKNVHVDGLHAHGNNPETSSPGQGISTKEDVPNVPTQEQSNGLHQRST